MILFVSGATGGHLYPAIAMNEALNTNASVVVQEQSQQPLF